MATGNKVKREKIHHKYPTANQNKPNLEIAFQNERYPAMAGYA